MDFLTGALIGLVHVLLALLCAMSIELFLGVTRPEALSCCALGVALYATMVAIHANTTNGVSGV
jgi:hypothetical protein